MEADTSFVDTEMDEMMVQDAGILSEVQEEITLGGAEDVSSQFTISLPTHAPVGAASPSKDLAATAGTTTTKTGEEVEFSAGKKRGRKPKSAAKSDIDLSVAVSRRGRSAVIMKKEEVEEEEAFSGQTEVAPPALVVEEGRRTRSSGRNPRPKKFDPDFCYDESVAFAGGRKRTGSVKSGVNSSTPKSTKSVVLISKAPLADDPSSSCVAKASSEAQVDTDKYFFPGSPAADDEAKETGGAPGVALADDVMGPSVLSAQQTAVPQKKSGNGQFGKRQSRTASDAGSTAEPAVGQATAPPPKLYCICKKPYDKRFMISCDECEEWFHGTCVGVTKKQGEKLARQKLTWLCPACKVKKSAVEDKPLTTLVDPDSATSPTSSQVPTDDNRDEKHLEISVDHPEIIKKEKLVKKMSSANKKDEKKSAAILPEPKGEKTTTSTTIPEKRIRTPSPKKAADSSARETAKEKPPTEIKLKEVKSKHTKVEEKPPVESDSTGLVLTALGKPAAAGSRTLRHTHISKSTRPPPIPRADCLFDSPKPTKALASPLLRPDPRTPLKPHTASKLKPCLCIVCKKVPGRENSLYCSSECIMRHGMDALELVKSSHGTPPDRIAVLDKLTGQELAGNDAPIRTALLAWLEGHQTYSVNIPANLLQAKAEKAVTSPQLDTVRASTRMMLKDHLLNRWREAVDLHDNHPEETVADVATKIEMGLFSKFKEPNQDYKKKYRVIVLNINDKKNGNFFRRLIQQEIPPGQVVDLSQEQMASDSLQQWRQEVERKELDLIIQTQMEEQLDQRPVIKKTHRGDEFLADELADETEVRPEQQPNLQTSLLTDPMAAEAEHSSDSRANFSPAALIFPTDTIKSPNYSFSTHSKVSPGGTPQLPQGSHDGNASPDQPYSPIAGKLTDASEEVLRAEHKSHIFEINCKLCTNSFGALSPSGRRQSTGSTYPGRSPKNQSSSKRHLGTDGSPMTYSSPTGSGFKVPTGSSSSDRKRKSTKFEEDVESPVSSTSEYSPGSEDELPAGVIWQGEVDTKDLPAAKLQAFCLYGKAAEFMTELPAHLDQLGRIQHSQLWPYIEQVKPLKEIAVVMLKSPPGRLSNEFNSLHYFLTTRGRVSVLGPLPTTFKDFYMIALKENEPMPESLHFPESVAFEAEHPKIFIGIIVHHLSTRGTSVGRGIFDVPPVSSVESKKLSPYPSPRTPDSSDAFPVVPKQPRTTQSHDPIVSRFLAMEGAPLPVTTGGPADTDSTDTSEPMDIDDDTVKDIKIEDSKSAGKSESTAKSQETKADAKPVSVPDLLKLVHSLPSKTQAALGLAPNKSKAAPPVDPRLSRFNQPVVDLEKPTAAKQPLIKINLQINSSPHAVASPVAVSDLSPTTSASASSATMKPDTSNDKEIESSFGFSQKFIENLAKIEFPEGLKEALRSIAPTAEVPKASLLGLPPIYSGPPPQYAPVRPNFNVPPPSLRPGFPRPQFPPHAASPGYHEQHAGFPPRPERWAGPPLDHQQRHQFNQERAGNPYGQGEFRGPQGGPHGGPPPPDSRWGDRPDRDGNGRRHSPPHPVRDRDRRDWDRSRNDPPRDHREDGHSEDRGTRWNRNDERPPRRRSRSRSPTWNRRDDRNRRDSRESRDRGRDRDGARRRDADSSSTGIDEFGRDMSLRRQLSGSRDRDSAEKTSKAGLGRASQQDGSSDRDGNSVSRYDERRKEDAVLEDSAKTDPPVIN